MEISASMVTAATYPIAVARRPARGMMRDALAVTKTAVTRISAPSDEEIRAAAVVLQHPVREGSVAPRTAWLLKQGLQTRGTTERELGEVMATIPPHQV
ncbi:hypothetical protein [Streptomyces sp. NPDC048106]|uniref:hypothetical protein n=1 Tax=Streptomyces sp. NPDC048106 TaxID=3155750 RepID=UPI0034519A18